MAPLGGLLPTRLKDDGVRVSKQPSDGRHGSRQNFNTPPYPREAERCQLLWQVVSWGGSTQVLPCRLMEQS